MIIPATPASFDLEPGAQRKLAARLFNYVWTLIEKSDRTASETELMIDSAHASRFFWEGVGEPVNRARGEWQISRTYAIAGRPEPAAHHAELCLTVCRENGIGGFDLGYAYEALARVKAMIGDATGAAEHTELARRAAAEVEDPQDRELLLADLAGLS